MKSKKLVVGLVLLNFIFVSSFISNATSNNPKQANGDYSLGYGIGDEFEFFCTVFDTTELANVFGGDWQLDVGSFFWFADYAAPTVLGQKTKFAIVNITDHPSILDWWEFIIDGWDWIDSSASHGAPVREDIGYNMPKNSSSEYWNDSVWLILLPVVQCLSGLLYFPGFTTYENAIIYSDFDIDNFYVFWIYDENTGVVKTFRIRNDSATIFELNSPTSAPSKDEIPGYSLYILISTIVLLISFISIILIKKVKWN